MASLKDVENEFEGQEKQFYLEDWVCKFFKLSIYRFSSIDLYGIFFKVPTQVSQVSLFCNWLGCNKNISCHK